MEEEASTSIRISPVFSEGPYGHKLRLHQYESVLLIVGGTGVTFALPFLIDLVRRARSSYLGGSKPLTTKRLTFVWSVRSSSEVGSIGDELRQAIHYAPPGFLDLQIYVTRLEPPSDSHLPTPSLSFPSPSTTSLPSTSDKMFKLPNTYLESINPDRRSSTSSDTTTFSYLPSSPTDSQPLPIPISDSSLTLIPKSVPISSIVLPLIPGRCRPRDILEKVVAETSFSGSVAAASCGPSQLVNEVGRACSDINEPSRVLRGEHRLNVVSRDIRFLFFWNLRLTSRRRV